MKNLGRRDLNERPVPAPGADVPEEPLPLHVKEPPEPPQPEQADPAKFPGGLVPVAPPQRRMGGRVRTRRR